MENSKKQSNKGKRQARNNRQKKNGPSSRVLPNAEVQQLIQAMITADQAVAIPRQIPTAVYPVSHELSFTAEAKPGTYGAAIIYPSFKDPVLLWIDEALDGNLQPFASRANSFQSNSGWNSVAVDLQVDANINNRAIGVEVVPHQGTNVVGQAGEFTTGKLAYYPGTLQLEDAAGTYYRFSFYNSDSHSAQIEINIGSYDPVTEALTFDFGPASLTVQGHHQDAVQWNRGGIAITEIVNPAFCWRYLNSAQEGHIPSDTVLSYSFDTVDSLPFIWEGSGFWQPLPFSSFDLSPAVLLQIESASSISFTAMSVLIKALALQDYEGGLVRTYQMPSGSVDTLPKRPSAIWKFLGTLTRKKDLEYEKKFQEGTFYSYVPDFIQDLQFKSKAEIEQFDDSRFKERPYAVFVWKTPRGTNIPSQDLVFDIKMMAEYITVDTSCPPRMGPMDLSNFMAAYSGIRKIYGTSCCNPSHWETIKDWTLKLAKDPGVQMAAKGLFSLALAAI